MAHADLVGAVLDGRYKVLEPVAEGAMGVVYRAERVKLGRIVAVKLLHDQLPEELSSRERFEIEAMAMAKLEHPHCAAVLDVGTHDGRPFVVMDFVTGQDLKSLIAEGPVAPARAVEIVRQVLTGLAHAHELGIIHRDIKPANILLSQKAGLGDHVKILDFGLARLQAGQASGLTTGIVVGTPAYMAPEQIRGTQLDARTDLYACGVLLMELLTGQKPFYSPKDDPIEVVQMHLKKPPPRLSELLRGRDFGELEAIVARALAKQADDRYQSATEFAAVLEAWRPAEPEPSQQISDSMVIPQGETRIGMVALPAPAPAADAATTTPGMGGPPGPAPLPGVAPPPEPAPPPELAPPPSVATATAPGHGAPALPSAPATSGSLVITPDPAAVSTSIGFDHTAPALIAATPPPAFAPAPAPAPIPAPTPAGPGGLPFTPRQLAIAGGGLLALIVLVALLAGGGKDAPPAATEAPAPPPAEIEIQPDGAGADQVLAEAEALIASGDREAALRLLTRARKDHPDSARLHYLTGTVYFDKLWWRDGLESFRAAIRLEPAYRNDPELIKTVLKGFITTPSYHRDLAQFLREDIGPLAEGYLEETARDHPSAKTRARAAQELERYR